MKSVFLMAGLAASASTTLFVPDTNSLIPLIEANPLIIPAGSNYIRNGNFEFNPLVDGDWVITK